MHVGMAFHAYVYSLLKTDSVVTLYAFVDSQASHSLANQWMRRSYVTDKNGIKKQLAPNLIFSIKLFPQLH